METSSAAKVNGGIENSAIFCAFNKGVGATGFSFGSPSIILNTPSEVKNRQAILPK